MNKFQTEHPSGGELMDNSYPLLAAVCSITVLFAIVPSMHYTVSHIPPLQKHRKHLCVHLRWLPRIINIPIIHMYIQTIGTWNLMFCFPSGHLMCTCTSRYTIHTCRNVLQEDMARFRHIYIIIQPCKFVTLCLYTIPVGDRCFPIHIPTQCFTGNTFGHFRNLIHSPPQYY